MNAAAIRMTGKIFKYELNDIARSKWLVAYFLFFLVLTDALFRFGGGSAQVLLSLLNVVLIIIPMVCIVFGTMYLYNARAFVELMLSQPVPRRSLFGGQYLGLALSLSAGYAAGIALPFLLWGFDGAAHARTLGMMVVAGVLLTFIFVAFAAAVAACFDDRVKGLGAGMLLWLFLAVIYDGIVLVAAGFFAGYPLERPMIALALLNPVDLARILLLMNFDVAALMGYTGAVFERFFGSSLGMAVSGTALLAWLAAPLVLAARRFDRKDF